MASFKLEVIITYLERGIGGSSFFLLLE